MVNRRVTTRSTEKQSPLLSGVTLVEHDATLIEVDDDLCSSSDESVSSDSSDDSFDGGWERHAGLHELTEEQRTPDWFIARSFVSTSTTQLEINRAVSLVGVEDDSIRVKFEAINQVIGMRVSAPTPEEAPEIVRNFLVALGDGVSIDTTAKDSWWKGKNDGKAITGTQHIDPALCHLGVKVLRLLNNVLFSSV